MASFHASKMLGPAILQLVMVTSELDAQEAPLPLFSMVPPLMTALPLKQSVCVGDWLIKTPSEMFVEVPSEVHTHLR